VPETFHVLSGDDAITIPLTALGGKGIISVVSNQIPREMTELARKAREGDYAGARALQRHWLPLMDANFVESNPVPVKYLMAKMGLLQPVWRLPMCPPLAATMAKLDAIWEAFLASKN